MASGIKLCPYLSIISHMLKIVKWGIAEMEKDGMIEVGI